VNKWLVVDTVYRRKSTSRYYIDALISVNVIVQLNSDLVAFAWRTLLADQRLVDVRNNTWQHRTDSHINSHQYNNTYLMHQTLCHFGYSTST